MLIWSTTIQRGARRLLLVISALVLVCSADPSPNTLLQQTMARHYGDDGVAILNAWQRMLDDARALPETEQLKRVNDFFNHHIRYREDIDHWGQSDYWATPLETLGSRAGDCEDFTIAKYVSLLRLGIPEERLRLIYVRAQVGGSYTRISQAHMVLGYYESPRALPLVLDNMVTLVQPADERTDLHPVFSFNSQGLWIGNSTQSQADPNARLSRWRDLLARMQAEGFYQ